MKWFVKCLKNYAVFKGRARRADFWYYTLFHVLALVAVLLLAPKLLGKTVGMTVYYLCVLALFVPSLAVAVRRLHDTNRSGKLLIWIYGGYAVTSIIYTLIIMDSPWMIAILLFPLAITALGICIYLLILFCTAGTRGENRYGEDPRLTDEAEELI